MTAPLAETGMVIRASRHIQQTQRASLPLAQKPAEAKAIAQPQATVCGKVVAAAPPASEMAGC